MNKTENIVDKLRFINKTHTTVRSLVICNKILKAIGKKQVPKYFLKEILFKWSKEAEKKSKEYKNHKGKLTEGGVATTAFPHYLELLKGLGLIHGLGDLFGCTKLGILLTVFDDSESYILNDQQKFFYLFTLIYVDADAIILLLNILIDQGRPSQKEIQNKFEGYFLDRLIQKQKVASSFALKELRNKYASVQFEWKRANVYAEHLVAPRLEWMDDLGLVSIQREGGFTFYAIKEKGQELYKSFISLPNSNILDINDQWIKEKAISSIIRMVSKNNFLNWHVAKGNSEFPNILHTIFSKLFKFMGGQEAMRVSLLPGLLFIANELAFNYNIISEFNELINEFESGLIVGNKNYRIKTASRITEGYISATNIT